MERHGLRAGGKPGGPCLLVWSRLGGEAAWHSQVWLHDMQLEGGVHFIYIQ